MLSLLVAAAFAQEMNVLSPAEKRGGWKLLFDGQTTGGWHSFKGKGVGEGWVVKDGVLTSGQGHGGPDILSDEKFAWFELKLEYNIGKGQNAGIMFHVSEEGGATWFSGPEFQLFDNESNRNVQQAGWLYDLYSAKIDATKPAGEWNQLRIVISKKKCFSEMNGKRYVEFVLGSKDFNDRVAKSKFSAYPDFGKLGTGSIAIQGDHGVVSYRNIKVRALKN
jgi:hypothetical protein